MGNSSGKEQRPPAARSTSYNSAAETGRHPHPHSRSVSENSAIPIQTLSSSSTIDGSRRGRSGRPDLSALGISHNSDRDIAGLENRRETKQEREARRLERERVARVKERERSMKEESVDGGYLVTQGVYTGTEDFNKAIVRRLMIERRLAPFFKGMNDFSSSWRDDQLVAAIRGQPIPVDAPLPPDPPPGPPETTTLSPASQDQMLKNLTIDISSRSPSFTSDSSANLSPARPTFAAPVTGPTPLTTSSSPFRPRSKTLASLTSLARNYSQDELTPQEIRLPSSSFIDGRPIEAVLYKDASECPICFLYYPPYLNRTRCCDQPICSECFVQIKRPDPHLPEHAEAGVPATNRAETRRPDDSAEDPLVSEPASCPFCVQPEFGVTYDPPPFRTGLAYANHRSVHALAHPTSAMSSSSSLASGPGHGSRGVPVGISRRRTGSISASSSAVITTDRIRPDWSQKLADARAHAARRSAAATALHTAVYLISGEGRSFAGFGRRGRLGRNARSDANGASPLSSGLRRMDSDVPSSQGPSDQEESSGTRTIRIGGPSGSGDSGSRSGRRSRLEDLEEMMMMEAIRLSLASEEERKRKEEQEVKEKALQERSRPSDSDDDDTRRTRMKPQPETGAEQDSEAGRPSTIRKGKAIDRGSLKFDPLSSIQHAPSAGPASGGSSTIATDIDQSSGSSPAARAALAGKSGNSVASALQTSTPVSSAVSEDGARPPSPSRAAVNTDGKFAFGSLDAMVGSDGEPDDGRLSGRLETASGEIRGH